MAAGLSGLGLPGGPWDFRGMRENPPVYNTAFRFGMVASLLSISLGKQTTYDRSISQAQLVRRDVNHANLGDIPSPLFPPPIEHEIPQRVETGTLACLFAGFILTPIPIIGGILAS